MTTKGERDEKVNVQTDDTASQSATSGFIDVPQSLYQDTNASKEKDTVDKWLQDKEELMKEQLQGAESMRSTQMEFF